MRRSATPVISCGRSLSNRFEHRVLARVPGYLYVKALTRRAAGFESDPQFAAALIHLDDSAMLGFVVERDPGGLVTVFVPSAPTPLVGTIFFVTEDRAQMLRVPPMAAVSSILRLGVGSRALVRNSRPGASGPP